MIDIRASGEGAEARQLPGDDVEAKRRVSALTLTGLPMIILAIAGLYVAMTPRNVDQACFQKKMNDEHTLMEAFFQAPAGQDAVVEAMRACSH
ncbi:hypothetical protein ABH944_006190 [Caballeronia udeis]|jgi:hypothetical protein|uniref:Uncharacterized protein n=1 Tax=Caballeronia udeis TaxID=1232866 RepID=A0ABW8MQP6_9BURK